MLEHPSELPWGDRFAADLSVQGVPTLEELLGEYLLGEQAKPSRPVASLVFKAGRVGPETTACWRS